MPDPTWVLASWQNSTGGNVPVADVIRIIAGNSVIAVPSASDPHKFMTTNDDVPSLQRIAGARGYTMTVMDLFGTITTPLQAIPAFRTAPVGQPAAQPDATGPVPRIRAARARIRRTVTQTGDGAIEVNDAGQIEVRRGTENLAPNSGLGTAEREARENLARVTVAPDLCDKIVDVLVTRSSETITATRQRVASLTARHHDTLNGFGALIGTFQMEKVLRPRLAELTAELLSDAATKAREDQFKAFTALVGTDAAALEVVFAEKVRAALTFPAQNASRTMDAEIKKLVETEASLQAESRLLTASTSELKTRLASSVASQFAVIKSLDFLTDVKFRSVGGGASLVFITKDVTVTYRNRKYSLGRFEVSVNISTPVVGDRQTLFNIRNLTAPSQAAHPHINDANGGTICWGNIREGVYKTLADWNWPMLINIIWSFLNSYNEHDRYFDIDRFCQDRNFAIA